MSSKRKQQRCWRRRYFRGSLWWQSRCWRLTEASFFFPMQAGGGGCQQRLRGVYTLVIVVKVKTSTCLCPQNMKRLREGIKIYPAQGSTLDARAGSLLTSQLNYVVKSEPHTAVSTEKDKTYRMCLAGENKHTASFPLRLCLGAPCRRWNFPLQFWAQVFPGGPVGPLWRPGRGEQSNGWVRLKRAGTSISRRATWWCCWFKFPPHRALPACRAVDLHVDLPYHRAFK